MIHGKTVGITIGISAMITVTILAVAALLSGSGFAEKNDNNGNHEKNNDHDNDDFCEELRDEFEELNDVVNLDTATDEQIDAVEELRKFLVFEFDCVDEFEDFEWT
jgi:hypothetical protein